MAITSSRLLTVLAGISVFALSFWLSLLVMDALDARREDAAPTFSRVVDALKAGRTIIIRLDDDPAERRDSTGHVDCGRGTATGALGTLVAGEEYELTYAAGSRLWTLVGPYRESPMCQRHLEQVGPFDDRPEKGEIVLWGAHMTFDQNIDVYNVQKKKVGHIMRIR
jgi:hypothetical protein